MSGTSPPKIYRPRQVHRIVGRLHFSPFQSDAWRISAARVPYQLFWERIIWTFSTIARTSASVILWRNAIFLIASFSGTDMGVSITPRYILYSLTVYPPVFGDCISLRLEVLVIHPTDWSSSFIFSCCSIVVDRLATLRISNSRWQSASDCSSLLDDYS